MLGHIQVGLGEQQDKFIAAIPAKNVCLADAGFYPLAQRAQDLISYRVTIGIVNVLEIIQVKHQRRERMVETQEALHLALAQVKESPAVVLPGERISDRELLNLGMQNGMVRRSRGGSGKACAQVQVRLGESSRVFGAERERAQHLVAKIERRQDHGAHI